MKIPNKLKNLELVKIFKNEKKQIEITFSLDFCKKIPFIKHRKTKALQQ